MFFNKEQTLKMNSSFNAYLMGSEPEVSNKKKRITLKKSMKIPDDTFEYWGFFLPKGSQMELTVCSKMEGARILVVKGGRNLETCGLLNKLKNEKFHPPLNLDKNEDKVWVIFETIAEKIHNNKSENSIKDKNDNNNNLKFRNSRSVFQSENDLDFNDAREIENTDARNHMFKYHERVNTSELRTIEESVVGHKLRHSKQKSASVKYKPIILSNKVIEDRITAEEEDYRKKRNIISNSPYNLDIAKVAHGGNAFNFTDEESSASSFESSLFNCFEGKILFNHVVPSSDLCLDTSHLYSSGTKIMTTTHNVSADGDYDDAVNSIHGIFDIYKPTYEYSNYSKNCLNKTECNFNLNFFSKQKIIVEVPTKNGIEHNDDDMTMLLLICHPRMTLL
ncbi:hypothetical protein Phum_PHUM148750 [Pediculus humanus corporis]|uniref:Uncharacterized protein n=1 Tax=Pediculus humanus subsp. corporis TaxID=121224 RepID=E0VF16_PEDHC|nr:uncharacterized protein Phum_PHUM148750 [Pediculus humanus corporis]EEB11990.1 hypothetical protein Phum_PHUM148750 [Pediculus humanus corporis]